MAGETEKTVSPKDIRELVDYFAGGLQYFTDLAAQAGQLAGEGDYIGALSILGGEQNARDLLGKEYADEIIEGAKRQIAIETEDRLGD